jgi:hypothetical protein
LHCLRKELLSHLKVDVGYMPTVLNHVKAKLLNAFPKLTSAGSVLDGHNLSSVGRLVGW